MDRKVVVNTCYGGFGLSREAILWLREKGVSWAMCPNIVLFGEVYSDGSKNDFEYNSYHSYNVSRDDKNLVACVEILGEKANGDHSDLEIVKIPEDVAWEVEEYDGKEWVAEKHRTWQLDNAK